mmetsp:Transcript_1563/g.3015  ORF Transcript_1563/g.3015 Transcript_1563/m.3015 type:complete len:89 (+) Transcript_1563:945-1211(+)
MGHRVRSARMRNEHPSASPECTHPHAARKLLPIATLRTRFILILIRLIIIIIFIIIITIIIISILPSNPLLCHGEEDEAEAFEISRPL